MKRKEITFKLSHDNEDKLEKLVSNHKTDIDNYLNYLIDYAYEEPIRSYLGDDDLEALVYAYDDDLDWH